MYYIVEFHSLKPKEIAVVPQRWLINKNTSCVWPPTNHQSTLAKLVQQSAKPEDDWLHYDVRLLHAYKTYSAARKKFMRDEDSSDSGTDQLKRKPKKRHREEDEEESYDSEEKSFQSNLSSLNSFSDPIKPKGSPLIVDIDLDRPLKTNPSSSPESNSSFPGDIDLDRPLKIIPSSSLGHNSTSNGTSPHIHSQTFIPSSISLNEEILQTLKQVQEQLEKNSVMLQQLLGYQYDTRLNGKDALPDNFPGKLPFGDLAGLQTFNDFLLDEVNFAQTLPFFVSIGGDHEKMMMRRILEKAIDPKLAVKINWKGRGWKKAFHPYTKIHSLIHHAVKQNFRKADLTLRDVENFIKDWFRFAPERFRGRVRRVKEEND